MMNLKLKKNIFFITSSFIIISVACHEHRYTPKYEIIKSDEDLDPFAKYERGFVYIGNEEYLESIKGSVNPNDILVLDNRFTDDPNMIIFESHKISDKEIRNTILEILMEYENLYPTEWERTIESMRNEWLLHNMSYGINYKLDRSKNVDLNNLDEDNYSSKILTKILGN